MRVGLVGTGGIARAHASACAQVAEVELVAICDVSEENVQRFGEEFGVEARYVDLQAMLAEAELDIAIICTWGVFHAELGMEGARSKKVKAILCEKPFTQTAAEARSLVDVAKEHGVLVAEAFKFRHHPMHLKAKELVDAGAIGQLLNVRSTFCTNVPIANRQPELNWRFNAGQGGGSIYDLACYNIHHARFIFSAEPERVFATQVPGVEVDDAAFINMAFAGGRTAQISVGFNAWGSQYAEIVGDEGMLYIEQAWNNENQEVVLEQHGRDGVVRHEYAPTFQFALQLEHLCACVRGECSHRIPPAHSIAQMRALDAIKESMEQGVAVEI
jgi:xylose dehydrogenase (NAD/NADP)